MENFKVRTYNPAKINRFSDSQTPKELRQQNEKIGEQTPKNALFILSRGQNAGKPLFESCPNCYILYCKDQNQLQNLYWTFYTLWKNGFFHPYLCGSVILMLRLFELKKVMQNFIIPSLQKMEQNEKILSDIKAVYLLEQKFTKQLQTLSELRAVLVRKYYFKI